MKKFIISLCLILSSFAQAHGCISVLQAAHSVRNYITNLKGGDNPNHFHFQDVELFQCSRSDAVRNIRSAGSKGFDTTAFCSSITYTQNDQTLFATLYIRVGCRGRIQQSELYLDDDL